MDVGVEGEDRDSARELARWRRQLMPFAVAMLGLLAAVFVWQSQAQFLRMQTVIAATTEQISQPGGGQAVSALLLANDKEPLRTRVDLAMQERMQRTAIGRASASLMLSLWTRYMGFLTGMILALVGSMFILSRLSDDGTDLTAQGAGLNGALKTSSPGIVLAVLGTGLMVMAMTVRYSESAGTQSTGTQIGGPQGTSPAPAAPAANKASPDDDTPPDFQTATENAGQR